MKNTEVSDQVEVDASINEVLTPEWLSSIFKSEMIDALQRKRDELNSIVSKQSTVEIKQLVGRFWAGLRVILESNDHLKIP